MSAMSRRTIPTDNYRMANETLLSKLPVPADHGFRVPAEMPDAGVAAQVYEQTLRNFFRPAAGSFPMAKSDPFLEQRQILNS